MVFAPQPSPRSHTVVLPSALHWNRYWRAALAVPLMLALLFTALALAASPGAHASGGAWQEFTYSGPAGSRPYFVYTPAGYQTGVVVPLFVMLHGCLQTPSDFAAGTQMDALADAHQFIVVYPQQTSAYNSSECWNWFLPADQSRGSGEPAIIAGIVQTVEQTTSRWSINTHRVYVAGMSAGAAMAVILGATYPDIFAAIGGHTFNEFIWKDANGKEVQEYWFVYGMGHAWSGGSTAGSFTDPFGPSASQAMYTFFMNHPK